MTGTISSRCKLPLRGARVVAGAAALVCLSALPSSAQVTATFTPTLQLKVAATSSFSFTEQTKVSRLPSGGYVVGPISEVGRIAWFDAQGRFQRLTGRRGEGPGELGAIHSVTALPDGRVAVGDARFSIVTAMTDLAERQVDSRDGRDWVGVAPNTIVQTKLIMPGGQGDPFAVWSGTLDSLRTIKDPFSDMAGDVPFRRLARHSNRSIVVSPVTAYEFALLEVITGRATLVPVKSPRFPSAKIISVDNRPPHIARPYPRILALSMRGADTLVVLHAAAAPNWAPAAPRRRATSKEGDGTPALDMGRYLSFYYDLLDVRNGQSLGSGIIAKPLMAFAAPDLAYALEEAADGDFMIQLYRMTLSPAVKPQ